MDLSFKNMSALLLSATLVSACGDSKHAAAPAHKPVAVTVATPIEQQVSDVLELDGVVAPSATVNLVARVAGYLQGASFKDGDQVRKGQVLFQIEPEPYREQVRLNEARLDQARAEAGRQESLLRDKATSQASVENARSQMKQAEVNLRLAQINLDYSQVRASFDGVVGRRQVDVGNYVGATPGGTVLGTIQQVSPAYVGFAISERDLLRLRARLPAGSHPGKSLAGRLKVQAALQGEARPSATGVLDFIDNGLSGGTGTMQLRARFPNTDLHLIPGMYAKVSIEAGSPRSALLLPNAVMQSDQQGSYIYVVDGESKARRRNIKLGQHFGKQSEVLEGLKPGEKVVIDGVGNVAEGQLVQVRIAADRARS